MVDMNKAIKTAIKNLSKIIADIRKSCPCCPKVTSGMTWKKSGIFMIGDFKALVSSFTDAKSMLSDVINSINEASAHVAISAQNMAEGSSSLAEASRTKMPPSVPPAR